jgi:hypothetical protein
VWRRRGWKKKGVGVNRRLLGAVLVAVVLAGGLLWAQDGPLATLMNLQGRTDANGYLLVSGGAYSGSDGPLTVLSGLQGRTDANGYLRVSLAGGAVSSALLAPDGTSGAPAYAFASEPTLGLYRVASGQLGVVVNGSQSARWTGAGYLNVVGSIINLNDTGSFQLGTSQDVILGRGAAGNLVVANTGSAIGIRVKVDALPTIGSGFGTSPSVTAGSTPFAGSVNVGTGGAATTGVITFNGTAFPSAPFCTYSTTTTNAVTRGTPTTTQLTLNSTTAWTASDIVTWHCVSSK